MTPASLMTLAAKAAGVVGRGQTLSAEDYNDILGVLNMMLDEWSAQRWYVFHTLDVSCQATGNQLYSIGPNGDFNTVRPDRIEAAFWRSYANPAQPIDYNIEMIEAREDYNNIASKEVGTWPVFAFLDTGYPLATLYPWPIPTAGTGEIHLTLRAQLGEVTDPTQDFAFPPAYQAALFWNLADRIRPVYQLERDPKVEAMARGAANVIYGNNTQLPRLKMPQGLGGWKTRYNIFSDVL